AKFSEDGDAFVHGSAALPQAAHAAQQHRLRREGARTGDTRTGKGCRATSERLCALLVESSDLVDVEHRQKLRERNIVACFRRAAPGSAHVSQLVTDLGERCHLPGVSLEPPTLALH